MNTAIAYTPASGLSLPKLPPRSSSWRSMAPAAAATSTGPKKPEGMLDLRSHVAFPSLSSGGGSSARAPMLLSAAAATKPVMDFKKAAAAAPAATPAAPDTKIAVAQAPIAVKVYRHPYAEEEDDGWPTEEDEEGDEYNANIISDRRRGDKGFW